MPDSGGELPRLAAVIERQQREIAALRAGADDAGVIAMATGTLLEREGGSVAEASRHLSDLAVAAGLPLAEMAAAVLGVAPSAALPAGAATSATSVGDPVLAASTRATGRDLLPVAGLVGDGAELVAALASQVSARFDTSAIAVWLLAPDGGLELLGQAGLGGTDASRWSRLAPQFSCPQLAVAAGGPGVFWPAGPPGRPAPSTAGPGRPEVARAILPVRERTGSLLGVVEFIWPTARDSFDPEDQASLVSVAAGLAEVLWVRLAHGASAARAPVPALAGALDDLMDSALVLHPLRGQDGALADFAIVYASPGCADPGGRLASELARMTLLAAYPLAAAGDGLFAMAARVLASGRAEQVAGTASTALGVAAGTAAIADLRVVPFFDGVACAWRPSAGTEQLVELLDNAQRLGRMGAWEENLATGAVRWTDSAYALFGLNPDRAAPIPSADLHSFVIAADRQLVRRFRESLLRQREAAGTLFRIVRPGDTALRQIRMFAEPVIAGGDVVALRGAFQDVSAHYQTQVALAATQDQLADVAQRAEEEHRLAVRLQRAMMPPDAPPVDVTGIDVAVRYRPAEAGHLVAGDWYDTLVLPSKRLLIVVGDITGHGIEAATGMVGARNALRGLAMTGAGPAELLQSLNYAACHLDERMAGTVVCGVYDPQTQVLRWARAGHLPPILVRDGEGETLPLPEGVLLGLDPDIAYQEVELPLRSGDSLLLFTDGLVECRAGSISDALADFRGRATPVGSSAAEHADRVLREATSDTGDDACLVVMRIL
ncbi:MAG TPA: SpoIIE family protein phosphatase [Trebonia sp.]|nr:SpoIIE family protein phosphatase [Trebonia sp.]